MDLSCSSLISGAEMLNSSQNTSTNSLRSPGLTQSYVQQNSKKNYRLK